MAINYFLGANSPSGFVSLFEDWIGAADTNKVYIIKGTPGSGKSSFMKKIAAAVEEQGEKVEYIYCSADSSSLDGIRIPELGVLMVDGTAPHVVEPKYPYAVESYLNLGEFVNGDAVREQKDELVSIVARHKESVARTGRCISAAHAIQENIYSIVISGDVLEKISKRARGVVRREITKGTGAMLRKRYLNAVSGSGETVFWDTVKEQCENVYALDNNFGFSHFFLNPIMTHALEAGQEVIACYSPFDNKLEHLILPALSLGFVSIKAGRPYPYETYRHIRLDAIVPPERIRETRQKLRFLQKTHASIIREASQYMSRTKAIHDELENIYIPNIDFKGIDKLAESITSSLLKKHE